MKNEKTDKKVISLVYKGDKLSSRNITILTANGLMDYVEHRYPDSESVKETLYRLKNGIEEKPLCPISLKPLKFDIKKSRFNTYADKSSAKIATRHTYEEPQLLITRYDDFIRSRLFEFTCRIITTVTDKEKLLTEMLCNTKVIKNNILQKEKSKKDKTPQGVLNAIFERIGNDLPTAYKNYPLTNEQKSKIEQITVEAKREFRESEREIPKEFYPSDVEALFVRFKLTNSHYQSLTQLKEYKRIVNDFYEVEEIAKDAFENKPPIELNTIEDNAVFSHLERIKDRIGTMLRHRGINAVENDFLKEFYKRVWICSHPNYLLTDNGKLVMWWTSPYVNYHPYNPIDNNDIMLYNDYKEELERLNKQNDYKLHQWITLQNLNKESFLDSMLKNWIGLTEFRDYCQSSGVEIIDIYDVRYEQLRDLLDNEFGQVEFS